MSTLTSIVSALEQMFTGRRDPMRDWFTLLTVAAIMLAGVVIWNAWMFDTVAEGGVIGTTVTETAPAFNRASLENVHRIFEDRAEEEAKYRTGAYRYADPSQ